MLSPYPCHSRLFLWRNRALYFGPLRHLDTHVYGAAVLHVGIYRPFRLKIANGEPVTCRCAIVPAGMKHALDFAGAIHGKLFIEMDSADFLYFRRRFRCQDRAVSFFEDAETLECFRWMYEEDPDKAAIAMCMDRLLGCDGRLRLLIDSRVQAAIDLIRDKPDRNFSQDYLAAKVDLSPSRFLHLFRQHTGVPYRRFRMWKRLVITMEKLNAADTMTRAALDSGFADATHFSHCFRDTFGVNPAFVFRDIERFEVASPRSAPS
jgi:AraC-like DNA-binding protein